MYRKRSGTLAASVSPFVCMASEFDSVATQIGRCFGFGWLCFQKYDHDVPPITLLVRFPRLRRDYI